MNKENVKIQVKRVFDNYNSYVENLFSSIPIFHTEDFVSYDLTSLIEIMEIYLQQIKNIKTNYEKTNI